MLAGAAVFGAEGPKDVAGVAHAVQEAGLDRVEGASGRHVLEELFVLFAVRIHIGDEARIGQPARGVEIHLNCNDYTTERGHGAEKVGLVRASFFRVYGG